MGDVRQLGLGFGRHHGRIFGFALLALTSAVAVASPFGCGLDDTAITQFGADDGSTDGTVVQGEGGPVINDSGQPDAVVCNPETCTNYPSVCRSGLSDNCGKTIDCTNACPSGEACLSDSGTCDGPPICQDAGAPGGNCGTLTNPGNTSLTASCGTCANNGYTCPTNTCVCAPGGVVCGANCCNAQTSGGPNCNATNNSCCKLKTCADYAGPPQQCGAALDNGCGATTLNCSGSCGAGGTQCGPTSHTCDLPPACPNMGNPGGSCGTITGADGLSSNCGATCNTAGFTCTANVCQCGSATSCSASQVCFSNSCCTPDNTAACVGKCGTVTNNCGQSVDCGGCNGGEVCNGPGGAHCSCGTCGTNPNCCTVGQTCHTLGGPDHCD